MTALTRCDVPNDFAVAMQTADMLAKSDLLPNHLRGKTANVMAIGMAARALDVPWWQAIQSMQVISGKVGLSADLMRALILREGHTFRIVESTTERATVVGIRKEDTDRFEHVASFDLDDAGRAGLLSGSGMYKKYPKAMLFARATTMLARNAFSDVLAGMAYTPEELGAEVDEEGRVITVAQAAAIEPSKLTRVKGEQPPDEFAVVDAVVVEPDADPEWFQGVQTRIEQAADLEHLRAIREEVIVTRKAEWQHEHLTQMLMDRAKELGSVAA